METDVQVRPKKKNKKKTERDIEVEMGDDYVLDLNKKYDLANPDEKYDVIPEIWNGHNIADFVDSDILQKLEKLEKEEELRERAGECVELNRKESININYFNSARIDLALRS